MNKQKEEKLHQLAIQIEYQFLNEKRKEKLTVNLEQIEATPKYKLFSMNDDCYGLVYLLMNIATKKFAVTPKDSVAKATKRMINWKGSLDEILASLYKEELGLEDDQEFGMFRVGKMELKTVKVLSTLETHSVTPNDMAKIDLSSNCDDDYIMIETMEMLESMKEPRQKKTAKKTG